MQSRSVAVFMKCASITAPGYRVYYTHFGPVVVVLLCGGDKRTQLADIKRAARIAEEWQE
jgi:putative addiction module killer protein